MRVSDVAWNFVAVGPPTNQTSIAYTEYALNMPSATACGLTSIGGDWYHTPPERFDPDPPEAEWIHDDGIYAWAPIDDWTAYAGRGKRGAFHCIQ